MENKVKERRKKLGWTQDDLSRASGVPASTISEIENGRHIPGVDIALLLAKAMEVQVNDLFFL